MIWNYRFGKFMKVASKSEEGIKTLARYNNSPVIKSRLIACPINEEVFPTRFVRAACKLGVQRVYERRLESFAPYLIKVLEMDAKLIQNFRILL